MVTIIEICLKGYQQPTCGCILDLNTFIDTTFLQDYLQINSYCVFILYSYNETVSEPSLKLRRCEETVALP